MSVVLTLVASPRDLADLQALFPDETDVGIVDTGGGAVGLFSGGPTLAGDLGAMPQVLALVDDNTLAVLGPALDVLTVAPAQIGAMFSTLFGAGNDGILEDEVLATLAGYLLTFSPAAQATLEAAPSIAEEATGPCVPPRPSV